MDKLAAALVTAQRLPNPALVGKTARLIAEKVGIAAPEGTRCLIAPLTGVGRDYPLSIEKLCPVLSWYEVNDWREGCERCIQILRYGGMGHTMSIHSQNDDVILQFGLKKPAFRICVNTPTTHGSIGLTTGLDPAMTLGCGGWGGNITSDNISPRHLLNLKRLAWGIRPAVASSPASEWRGGIAGACPAAGAGVAQGAGPARPPPRYPRKRWPLGSTSSWRRGASALPGAVPHRARRRPRPRPTARKPRDPPRRRPPPPSCAKTTSGSPCVRDGRF